MPASPPERRPSSPRCSLNDPTTQISVFFSAILFLAIFALIALCAVAASGALLGVVARRALKKKQSVRVAFSAGAAHVGPLLLTQLVGRAVIFIAFVLAALGVYRPRAATPSASSSASSYSSFFRSSRSLSRSL